ncbi:MAG: hypothetical protein KAH16_03780 [Candidatus Izimaplasma sp.]|nr:hypothetical protein [Candidatus Izimaplasma bacterium]
MKALLVASMLFSGGSAVAMQNEEISETVTDTTSQVMYKVQNMFRGNQVENVKDDGFPYPSEEYLSTLTEEQVFEITSAIDVVNATYDWSNMTDEEIITALELIKVELHDLYLELGIEGPMVQTQTQTRARKGNRNGGGGRNGEDFIPR